jgi:hypothetical protein
MSLTPIVWLPSRSFNLQTADLVSHIVMIITIISMISNLNSFVADSQHNILEPLEPFLKGI